MKSKVVINPIVLLLLCLVILSNAALANYKKGSDAYDKGDYSVALQEYKTSAENGSAVAQHMMGVLYVQGKGVLKDEKEAYKWWEKSALNNHPPSQYNIGMAYFRGKYHYKDTSLAEKWLAKAAKRGHPSAQLNLGNMYIDGDVVDKDLSKAKTYIKAAFENPRAKESTKRNAKDSWEKGKLWEY
jgi:TPR repeat protein